MSFKDSLVFLYHLGLQFISTISVSSYLYLQTSLEFTNFSFRTSIHIYNSYQVFDTIFKDLAFLISGFV